MPVPLPHRRSAWTGGGQIFFSWLSWWSASYLEFFFFFLSFSVSFLVFTVVEGFEAGAGSFRGRRTTSAGGHLSTEYVSLFEFVAFIEAMVFLKFKPISSSCHGRRADEAARVAGVLLGRLHVR